MKRAMLLLAAAAALAGCEQGLKAPTERGVCFHVVGQKDAPPKMNRLPGYYDSLEYCAGGLELIRRRGTRPTIVGAYQGKFIFAERKGIFVGKSLTSGRYLSLVRTPDGRLAAPGAMRPAPPPGMTGT